MDFLIEGRFLVTSTSDATICVDYQIQYVIGLRGIAVYIGINNKVLLMFVSQKTRRLKFIVLHIKFVYHKMFGKKAGIK